MLISISFSFYIFNEITCYICYICYNRLPFHIIRRDRACPCPVRHTFLIGVIIRFVERSLLWSCAAGCTRLRAPARGAPTILKKAECRAGQWQRDVASNSRYRRKEAPSPLTHAFERGHEGKVFIKRCFRGLAPATRGRRGRRWRRRGRGNG